MLDVLAFFGGDVRVFGWGAVDPQPDGGPEESEEAGDDEGHAPADGRDDEGYDGQGEGCADAISAIEDAGGDGAFLSGEPFGRDFRVGGVGWGFADPEEKARAEEGCESVDEGGDCGEEGPPDDGDGVGDPSSDFVDEPS